jgi:hypothetical protein
MYPNPEPSDYGLGMVLLKGIFAIAIGIMILNSF